MKRKTFATTVLICGLTFMSACRSASVSMSATQPAYSTGNWPLSDRRADPAKIEIESATRFTCFGIPCQLLGVRESPDPAVRAKAVEFTRRWFERIGNYIGFYNGSNPLMTKDGTCVVWLRGYDSYLSCLNEELVRTGLVEINVKPWQLYAFTEAAKSGSYIAKWQQDLADANASGERGEKPHVLFEWP